MTKDISIIANGTIKEWFTALDLAALMLPGLPATKRNINAFAKRHNWLSTSYARKRPGYGGGWEYHIDLLPEEARKALIAKYRAQQMSASNSTDLVQTVSPQRAVACQEGIKSTPKVAMNDANGKQRQCAEARLALLTEIERRVGAGQSYNAATIGLCAELKAQDTYPDENNADLVRFLKLAIAANEKRNKSHAPLARRAVYMWRKAYGDHGFAGLLPGKRKEDPMDADRYWWLAGFLKFYAVPQNRTKAHALDMYIRDLPEGADTPSYDQVKKALRKLERIDPIAAAKGREGVLALKARKVYVSRSIEGLLPTDIYTGDGKTFDAFVAHPTTGQPIRPEITSILDIATRSCVGYSLGLDENSHDVAAAMRNSSQHRGVAAIFYVDNGKGFKNLLLDDTALGMLARLGTHKEHSLPYNSQARGVIERFNGSCYTRLAKELPSYCGKDMDREARMRMEKQIKFDLKEYGSSDLLISWNGFIDKLDEALEAYNNRPHSTLPETRDPITGKKRNMSPNECWAMHKANGFEEVWLSQEDADDLERPAVRRKVERGLVRHDNNRYFSIELQSYDDQWVMVCFDPRDAQKVWVRELDRIDGQDVPGKLICVAQFEGNKQSYFPVSQIEKKRQERADRQIKAKTKQIEKIREESNPLLLEHSGEVPMEMFSSSPGFRHDEPEPELVPLEQVEPEAPNIEILSPTQAKPRKRVFASDHELALWAIDNPETLTLSQKKVLAECLKRSTSLELFRMSGVDVEALRNVLRAAA